MNKSYITAIASSIVLLASSCNDFLDVRPAGEKVESEVFETAKGFEDAIYGVYGSLSDNSVYGMDLVWGIPELLTQNLVCGSTVGTALVKYQYDDNDYVRQRLLGVWTKAYQSIGYANNILQNLEKKSPDELEYYDLYKGEMLGVRAMLHFDLLRLFASADKSKQGIPYVTSYSFSVKPFVTVGEAYNLIVKDLTDAEALLAENDEKIMAYPRANAEYNNFQNYRETHMNVYAVRALLARVHWYFGDNAKAAQYAENVIASHKFPLVDVSEIDSYIAGVLSPKETIFGVYSTSYLDVSQSYLYDTQSFFSYDTYDDNTGTKHMLPWDALFALDIDGTQQDFRRQQFRVSDHSSARCLKLVDWKTIENNVTAEHAALISGVSLINASEMYLIAADALLSTNAETAKGYFNDEIASRGLTRLRSEEILTATRVFNEFHKETFSLGQHWFNMKRTNSDIVSNYESKTIPASDAVYVLPIPNEEFEYRPE